MVWEYGQKYRNGFIKKEAQEYQDVKKLSNNYKQVNTACLNNVGLKEYYSRNHKLERNLEWYKSLGK